jgi:hypothetical protein
MNKVPVGASIAHAYEFLFGRFFQIVGTVWLPALLFGTGTYIFLQNLNDMAHAGDAFKIGSAVTLLVVGVVVFVMNHSVLSISMTQEAFGVRKDLTLAHLVVGPRELRLFFAYVRYYIVLIVALVIAVAISCAALWAADKYGANLLPKYMVAGHSAAFVAALVLAVFLALMYVLTVFRLFFLLAPVASVEHRAHLSRAWALTAGSSVRIFIVTLLTCGPAAIAAGVAAFYILGQSEITALTKIVQATHPGNLGPLFAFLAAHAVLLSAIVSTAVALNGALLAGASAHAYRVTSGHEDPTDIEDDADLVAPLLTPAEPAHHEPAHHEPAPADHGHHDHHHDHEVEDLDLADEDTAPADDHSHGSHDDHAHHGHHQAHAHDGHDHGTHGHHGHDVRHFVALGPDDWEHVHGDQGHRGGHDHDPYAPHGHVDPVHAQDEHADHGAYHDTDRGQTHAHGGYEEGHVHGYSIHADHELTGYAPEPHEELSDTLHARERAHAAAYHHESQEAFADRYVPHQAHHADHGNRRDAA